jgi:hypothetical protein
VKANNLFEKSESLIGYLYEFLTQFGLQ